MIKAPADATNATGTRPTANKEATVDSPESSANSAHPHPPPTVETRECPDCWGEGYTPIDHRYDWTTGLLTIIGGLCCCCRGEGEVVVYLYRGGHA